MMYSRTVNVSETSGFLGEKKARILSHRGKINKMFPSRVFGRITFVEGATVPALSVPIVVQFLL